MVSLSGVIDGRGEDKGRRFDFEPNEIKAKKVFLFQFIVSGVP
jgi:hypothetical protein